MIGIMYVHSSNELYGADRSLLRLVNRIKDRYSPLVILPTDLPYQGLLSKHLEQSHIECLSLDIAVIRRRYYNPVGVINLFCKTVTSIRDLRSLVSSRSVALIHSNTMAVLSGAFAAYHSRIPHIWHIREIVTESKLFMYLITRLINRFSSVVIAVSNAVKENLILYNSELSSKVLVVNNGLDLKPFLTTSRYADGLRSSWGADNSKVVIGMVGRISDVKGQSYLLDVISKIKNIRSVKVVFVGGTLPGEEWRIEALQEKARRLMIDNVVIFEGFCEDTSEYMKAFDIFVLPSTQPDSFPNVVLEAMAAAKPIVANGWGGVIEQVEDKVSGFLVAPNNPSAMAEKIDFLVENPALRKDFGEAARARAVANFTLERHIQQMLTIYEDIIQ